VLVDDRLRGGDIGGGNGRRDSRREEQRGGAREDRETVDAECSMFEFPSEANALGRRWSPRLTS